MDPLTQYLQPTTLCDFDREPAIRQRALQVIEGCDHQEQTVHLLYLFVKDFPYGLEDWDIRASETLAKGWGMCSSKTNLLVALCRCLGIPARYRVYKIRAEHRLWEWLTAQDAELAARFGPPPLDQDHVDCEVYLQGWQTYDPSRDSALENGLRALSIPLHREILRDARGSANVLTIASFDVWARQRQRSRHFTENREALFARANEQLWRIRAAGEGQGD